MQYLRERGKLHWRVDPQNAINIHRHGALTKRTTGRQVRDSYGMLGKIRNQVRNKLHFIP